MNATWGISGPVFLAGYFAVIAVVTVLALLHRRVLFRGAPADVGRLGPQELADLAGSRERAVYVSAGALHAAGTIGTTDAGALTVAGSLPAGATSLDQAVHDAAGRGLTLAAATKDAQVTAALGEMRDRLVRRGYAIGPKALRVARRWVWLLAALIALGLARMVAGVMNHKPVGDLAGAIGLAAAVILGLSIRTVWASGRTKTGVKRLRSLNAQLDPSDFPKYSASGLALGVALFGPAALHRGAPELAASLGGGDPGLAATPTYYDSSGGGRSCGG